MESDLLSNDLPYRAEYAKSNRASCRGCKSKIQKEELRLAVMVQSPVHDGKTPLWHHFECFFRKQKPRSTDDIAHFESLRIEDQDKISSRVSGNTVILPDVKGKKGKKRDATAIAAKKSALKDYKIEYSVSSRAACRGCELKIMKDEIRVSKKNYESEVGAKYGGESMWHHLSCFAKLRTELGYFESADKLPGFKELDKKDQEEARQQLPSIKQEDCPDVKKIKQEDETDNGLTNKEEKLFVIQNKLLYKYRDLLKDNLKSKELKELLEENKQEVPSGVERILDRLADIMTFGALESCSLCNHGQFVFNKIGYVCHGNISEWTKCNNVTKTPIRRPFVIPKSYKEKYDFLANYKYTPRMRIFKNVHIKPKKEETNQNGQPKIKRELPALYNMEFVILGKTNLSKDDIKKQITKFGGKVTTKIHKNVMAVISNLSEVEKMNERMKNVKETNIHVVGEDFLNGIQEYSGKIPELVIKQTICDWGSDPNLRLPPEPSSSSSSTSKSKSIYTKSMPSTKKLRVKNGSAVDPETGLEEVAHIYEKKEDKYCAILTKSNIQTNQNSYYKLQLLESDNSQRYWLYRAWGRIGTTIGGTKLESKTTLTEAIGEFCSIYQERTGNDWNNRENFVKIPHKFYPVDVDYSCNLDEKNLQIDCNNQSNLQKEVQNLVKLLFDINEMKKLMLEFELDMEKMPLGKLSKKRIQNGYSILKSIEDLFGSTENSRLRFIDFSNQFYTLIPHNFGVDNPPVIDNVELLKEKLSMLDSLLEIEVAYNLMKSDTNSKHSIDEYYQKLNTEILTLDQTTDEYNIIKEYVMNTHGETHQNYELIIEEIFMINRKDELKRFKPFKKLHNRKLLWHGSRLTNYVGILSNGLKIAPPEAPVTGYMFGKGIYFSDMVSKSANYCCTNPNNSMGLLLLCEVALGDMYEKTEAEHVTKLPKGKHSTKGVGRTQPDPNVVKHIADGIEVPLGKGVKNNDITSSLLYNEYIVYDVAQVNIKYLVKTNFQYKY